MKQLWYGGTIYTMEKENETVEAVLVEEDQILAVGLYHELKKHADEQIDLKGATMYPGFVDSHLHMIFQGEKMVWLDLSKASSAEEMLQMIKEASKKNLLTNGYLLMGGMKIILRLNASLQRMNLMQFVKNRFF